MNDAVETVIFTVEGPIATATINRPERKNALNVAAYRGLIDAVGRAESDDAVRALIIAGAGGNFTSGNDLADFAAAKTPDAARIAIDFLPCVAGAQKPLIAAIEGFAVGIGTTMLLHCDFAYAGAGARFRLPFVNLGLTPEGGSSLLLPAVAGSKRAAELLLLGEPFDAAVAAESGLVTKVGGEGEAMAAARETAAKLAALPAEGLRLSKSLLKRAQSDAVVAVIEDEAKIFGERLRVLFERARLRRGD